MNLPQIAARRPVGTAMLYFCVAVLGVVASRQLAVDLMPEVDMPRVSVTTTYEGVAPEEMESLITRPLEQSLSTIEGLDKVSSSSGEGMSRVELQFAWGVDLAEAVNDVREKIDRVRDVLPEDAQSPNVFKFNLSDMPVAFLGLSGSGDVRRLRYTAEEVLSRRLERVPGVASVDVRGGREREIQVRLDQHRLSALGITARQVTQALRTENRNVSAGDMLETGKEVLIRTLGEFDAVEDIANVVVTSRDGRALFVRDLGVVKDTFRELTNELWIDSEPGMRMYVSKQSGANTVEVLERLRVAIDNINREFEGRLKVGVLYDGGTFIEQSVNNVRRGGIYGAMLALIVLLVFLRDLRATLIIGLAIPISVLATVALMYFNGFTLNVISLGGIALGIGMLVDSSIVVLENIYRKRKEGEGSLQAAISGSSEVSTAILAGTMTTIAVFIPVVFLSGFAGIFFKEMAVVVSFSLVCALAVALTLIPAAAAKWLPEPGSQASANQLERRLRRAGAWLRSLEGAYGRLLEKVLVRPKTVIATSVGLLVASFLVLPLVGFELMPESDEGRLNLNVELPVGTPVETTIETMQEIELAVRSVVQPEELEHLVTTAGPENWWRPASGNQGSMEVMLVPVSQRTRSLDAIVAEIRRVTESIPAAEVRAWPSSSNMMMRMMRGGGQRLSVEIRGHDLDTANRLGQRIVQMFEEIPGVTHPKIDREAGKLERTLHVDRKRLAELGLAGSDVAEAVELYVLGRVATRYRDEGDEYDVRVQLAEKDRRLLEQLPQLPVVNNAGQVVPLGAVVRLEQRTGPTSIGREAQQRILRVSAGFSDRGFGDVVTDVREGLGSIEVPAGFTVGLGGELAEQRKAFADLLMGVALAFFLVFTVMAVQFESLTQPMIIMTAVPFSFIGAVLALVLTGTTLNMNSFLGLIVLVGIVVNNAIVLVDYVNMLRRDHGLSLDEALIRGGRRRLRPILMTTLTTALGLTPLALGMGEGSEIQAPLARVVVGGLLTSTLITLVFVPTLYRMLELGRERRRAAKQSRRGQPRSLRPAVAPVARETLPT